MQEGLTYTFAEKREKADTFIKHYRDQRIP